MREAIIMGLSSLRSNKLRSSLTILGVMIAVTSVIGLASIIDGLNNAVNEEIDTFGNNIIDIDRFPPNTDWDELTDAERNRPYMTTGEANAIRDNCPHVEGVAPQNHYWAPGGNIIKYSNRKVSNIRYHGTWPDYLKVRDKNLTEGRFITEYDLQARSMVCVLGAQVAENLFLGETAIGKEVRLNGERFVVVGVFEDVKSNFDNDYQNNLVTIPLTTKEKLQPWDKALSLVARARSMEEMEQAKEEIINALRIYRRVPFNQDNNFALMTQDTFKEQFANITDYIYLGMIVITSVGLMVGGIGVMNIMLVSVTERTREIGVRKAIGAKRSNIIMQFLTEATTLSGAGGSVGILAGIMLGLGANSAFGFPLSLSMFWIAIGFVVSVSVGLVSGVYPAYKASRLDPIEALRYE
ncbi:MAG: ABC transporter permease [candidate division Zixibacteria bacterium]|nr:ABC transporter permease [candidate division Zixibacteria bacterium]MDH3938923.1 ABC transporter permease [candidate division Zixibacteria bacterium]MDH4034951.1 ABC transporter permease [candidate division Zixibacteria bacterium]